MSSNPSQPPNPVEDALKTFQLFQPELGALVMKVKSVEVDIDRREKALKTEQENIQQQKAASLEEIQREKLKFEAEMKQREQSLKETMEQHEHKVQWDREAIQLEKKDLEEAQNRAMRITDKQEPITVEVGGEKFRTELHTLANCRESIFPKLVESLARRREENRRDPYIFIDRDGKHFRFILNYLRQGKQVMKCSAMRNPDLHTLNEILYETQFYKIKGLEMLIKRKAVSMSNIRKFEELMSNFVKSQADGKFKYVTTRKLEIENWNLTGVVFDKVKFTHPVTFKNCILESARFSQCRFESIVNFTNVELLKAHFDHCEGFDINKFHLQDTDISEAAVNL